MRNTLRHAAGLVTIFVLSVSFHLNVAANENEERVQLVNKIAEQFIAAGPTTNSWVMRIHQNLATKDEVRSKFSVYLKNEEDRKRIGEIYYFALFKVLLGEESFTSLVNSGILANKYEINPIILKKFRRVHYDFLFENFTLIELKQVAEFVGTSAGRKMLNIDGMNSQIANKMVENFQDILNWIANEAVRLTLTELGKK